MEMRLVERGLDLGGGSDPGAVHRDLIADERRGTAAAPGIRRARDARAARVDESSTHAVRRLTVAPQSLSLRLDRMFDEPAKCVSVSC
jgi:hypothetical protein